VSTSPSRLNRRQSLSLIGAMGLAAAAVTSPVLAQSGYPNQPIRIIVPWPVGTPPDVAARVVASKLPDLLKQPVTVENKPGASGTVGLMELMKAPADGYTLGDLHYATAATSTLYPSFKVDLNKDLVGIGQMEWSSNVLVVSPSLNVNSLPELIEYVKKNPSMYASAGVGTPAHFSGLMFLKAAGLEATHVPYNNFGQAIADVSTGRVTFMAMAAPPAVPQVLGGKLKALAVTGPQRNPTLKDIPTVTELKFPTMQSRTWSGLVVRAGTPKEIVDRLSRDMATVMAMPDVREQLVKQQLEAPTGTPEQFRELITRDIAFGTEFVKANGIKID
jgi:tripartite-type tricarboxylate transporter receptor subunit TctC